VTRLTLGAIDESAIGPWQASIKAVVGKDVDLDGLRQRAGAAGTWHDHGVEFGVLDAGRLVALVQAFHCPRVSSPGAYEVGVLVLEPAERGHGVGTAALSLLTELLFVERGAHRVHFLTDVDNVAMRRSGERVGFRLEGTVRGSVELDGVLHDDALYGLTRDDPRLRPSALPGA
jgi:RimJ/RimL family protein N-acetyltransferase